MEKLKGASYASPREKLSSEERYRVEYEAGRYNRLMNELEGEYFGIPGVPAQCGKSWKAMERLHSAAWRRSKEGFIICTSFLL